MKNISLAFLLIGIFINACTDSAPTQVSKNCSKISLLCEEVGHFAVIGKTDEAVRYLDIMERAARDYKIHFGAEPVPTAIVMSSKLTPAVKAELEGAGFEKILPWLDAEAKRKMREQAITKQLADRIKHLPEAAQQQAMASLKTQLGAAPPALSPDKENGVLAHELGHLWFIAQFPAPSGTTKKNHAYGGWAPDWLDETAAVLMENAVLRDQRREQLKELRETQIIELETFLTMEHPLAQAAKNLVKNQSPTGGGDQVVFLSGEDADKFLEESGQGDAGNFYLQVSGFVDFMIKQTRDEAIFAKIASHLSEGENFASWAKASSHFENLSELESKWQAWVNRQ